MMKRALAILLLLFTPLAVHGATVLDSGLTTTGDTANVTSYATASFTVATGELLVAFVASTATTATGTMTDSQSLGFTKVTSALWGTSANTLYCFVANALTTGTSLTVTFDCTADAATGAAIAVARVSGMTKTGLTAIKQSATQANITVSTTPAPAFSASALTANPTLGAVANFNTVASMTAPTNWTERTEVVYSSPATDLEMVSRDSGFTGTTITWGNAISSGATGAAVIVELDASGVAPTAQGNFLILFTP
jgi:hypothetical protein